MLPLTAHRAKPAVRFAGSYRLIDFPLSNCLNSGIHRILIFPQYKALSLYRHLRQGWSFLNRDCGEYIKALPPQCRPGHSWYRGTADAIYQNLSTLDRIAPADVLILAGDHVYQMDYRPLLQYHKESHAEATVATLPVPQQLASQFGILTKDRFGQVISFVEKPKDTEVLPSMGASVLASMGIYVFRYKVMREVLSKNAQMQPAHDFGCDVLPNTLGRHRLMVFPFVEGVNKGTAYWRDVGTIDAFW